MVSMAMAVFPVWRSPMISSRCPRPMGIMASMALRPVCSGSRTGRRSTTPGAHGDDRPHLAHGHAAVEALDLLPNDLADFVGLDLWHCLGSGRSKRVDS